MIAHNPAAKLADEAVESFREEVTLAEEEYRYVEITREWRAELLDPAGWQKVLETFAVTMRMAVALTDAEGRLLGKCHNPQPAWLLARAASPGAAIGCPFCLTPPVFCDAVEDAVRTGKVVTVVDQAGLAHVAVPLSLGGQKLGTLIAGQVFNHYPEPLALQRVARDVGISSQQLWQQAVRQVPISRSTLALYAGLLASLGQAFLGQRYAAILERQLAQTSQRYRLFFEGVKDYALITMDRASRVTSWSSGAERLLGYTAAEIIGRSAACLYPAENVDRDQLQLAMLGADREGWVHRECWRVRKDGTRFLGSGVLAAIGEGDAREYGSLVRDVTALRRSEQDLQQAQKLEGIGVLTAGIAHDFNNLLSGIMTGLSIAKDILPADSAAYPIVELAEQSSVRAAELVAQLLAYSGKGKFVISRFDLSTLITEMVPLIAASIPKTVQLDLLLPPGLPWIEADASQVRQIVMNLIINGAEAIGPAGGTVRVSTGVSSLAKETFMEVKDSGSGMSEATQAKIFDPFFTTKFTGRGLGLSAVSGIVRGHKGKMKVDSVPGSGTTFTVWFPSVEPDVPKWVDPPALTIPRGAGTILVVDDEPVLRKLAGIILKQSGYSVLMAKDGREAVEVFRQNTPEIAAVLLDMTMPVMGGEEALRLIREIQPGVPVIVSSGYSEPLTSEEPGCDTVAAFIQKPYTAAKLVETIQEALQRGVRR